MAAVTIDQLEAWLDQQRRRAFSKARRRPAADQDALVHLTESDAFAEVLHYLRTGERLYIAGSEEREATES